MGGLFYMKKKIIANNGNAYVAQNLEVLPDAALASLGQVATVAAGGTVAFQDPFLKYGGTISGSLTVTNNLVSKNLWLGNYNVLADNSTGDIYLRARVIQNTSLGVNDGLFVGYANTSSAATRIFDGGTSNNLSLASGLLSGSGLRYVFGTTDNGKFAQFGGEVHAKSGLTVDSFLAFGNSGTRTETLLDAGEMGGKSGFFESYSPTNFPSGATSWWHLISSRHSNTGNNYAMQIAGSFFDQRIYFRKTGNNGSQAWREFVSADSAGNVGLNITNPYAVLHMVAQGVTDTIRFSSTIANSGDWTINPYIVGISNGGLSFTNKTSGSIPFVISTTGNIGFNNTNPQFRIDNSGDINTSGAYYLSGVVSNWFDGNYIRFYKRNGVPFLSVDNSNNFYDADTAHYFRGSGGANFLTLSTSGSYFYSYANKHLFGPQSDDGTANQFAGTVKVKSDFYVNGISYLGATRLSSYLGMANNAFQYWKDSGGADRRILGVSNLNNIYLGDIDSAIEGSVLFMTKYDHVFYSLGTEKMRLYQNGTLSIQGGFMSPIRTITGGTATYTINSTDHVVIINTSPGCTFNIDAPVAGNKGREVILKNISIATQTLSQNYINLSGSSTNQIPNNQSVRLKYNGSEIQQI